MTADWLAAILPALREGVRYALIEYGHERRMRHALRQLPANVTPINEGVFTERPHLP